MIPVFENARVAFSKAKPEKRPIIEDQPPVQRDSFLSDCLALAVSVVALIALGLLLG